MRGEGEILEAAAFVELDELGRDAFCVYWKLAYCAIQSYPCCVQQAREVEQIRRAGAVVEPDDAQQLILPAEFAPVAQRALRQFGELIAEVACP